MSPIQSQHHYHQEPSTINSIQYLNLSINTLDKQLNRKSIIYCPSHQYNTQQYQLIQQTIQSSIHKYNMYTCATINHPPTPTPYKTTPSSTLKYLSLPPPFQFQPTPTEILSITSSNKINPHSSALASWSGTLQNRIAN